MNVGWRIKYSYYARPECNQFDVSRYPKVQRKGQPSEHGWQPKKDCHLTATFCQSCKCIPVASVGCRFQKLQLPWCNCFGVCHSVACSTFWVDGLSLKRLNIYIYFSCPTIAVRLGGVLLHSLKMKCTSEYHIREASSIDATWWGLQPLAWFLAFWEWCVWLEM